MADPFATWDSNSYRSDERQAKPHQRPVAGARISTDQVVAEIRRKCLQWGRRRAILYRAVIGTSGLRRRGLPHSRRPALSQVILWRVYDHRTTADNGSEG